MIRAYTGKTGSGKTYRMVKDAYKFWRKGINVYSNTELTFSSQLEGKIKLTFFEYVKKLVIRDFKPKRGRIYYFENINEIIDVKEGLILFDEAQVLFNARLWEALPDEFQYKLQQHRKHKLDLICTTQNMGTIDISYRRLVHSWYHCRNIIQIGKSPRIWWGWFIKEEKDIDMLYNSIDDLLVDTIKTRWFFIHLLSPRLYDTMYDIGFRKFKLICLFDPIKKTSLTIITNKKKSLLDVKRSILTVTSLLDLKTNYRSSKSSKT